MVFYHFGINYLTHKITQMGDEAIVYKVKAGDWIFSFSKKEIDSFDCIKISPSAFHLIRESRAVTGKLTERDSTGKKIGIEIEGETFEVEINDELDLVLEKMGFGAAAAKQIKEIKAPMPGLVLEISVENGQEVLEGDKVLILEAMKMENSIMIHSSAKIKKINVKKGQAVEKGQVLIELE